MRPLSHPSASIPSLVVGLISNPAVIAIPLFVAGMAGASAVSPNCTFDNMVPRDRRRLNATVDLVPLSGITHLMALVTFTCLSVLTVLACDTGVPVQQANHRWEGVPAHRPQIQHHVHPVHSVASLRDPPSAYPAHHLDAQFNGVVHGYGNIRNIGGAVDLVPVPFPPSYDSADANASDQSL